MEEMSRGTQPGSEAPPTRWLEQVHTGMHVVDAAGERLGRVEAVRMGDPEAATTQGNEATAPNEGGVFNPLNVVGRAVGGDGEPDVPEPQRSQLLRYGYLKVDGPGLLDKDRYIRGDVIEGVSGDTVTLTVRKAEIPAEA